MAIAASISWLIAYDLLGHTTTFFAPVASTIVLSIVPGERSRRAVEMVVGIAVGIGVADLIIQAIGSGAVQIGIVVLLAVSVAILLGAGRVLASQAAATAVLVAALPASNQAFTRFTDALIGGLVGLVVLIVAPRNPVIPIRDEVESLLRQVAGALEDVSRAARPARPRHRHGRDRPRQRRRQPGHTIRADAQAGPGDDPDCAGPLVVSDLGRSL